MSDHDEGFTLIELLLAVAIAGVLIPAAALALMVFFETSYSASVRADRSHDDNLLASWLQPDLASTQSTPVLSGGCSNTLTLSWNQQDYVPNGNGTTQAFVTTYAVVAASGNDGPFVLQRSQTLNGSPSGANVIVAHNLDGACKASFSLSGQQVTATVTQPDNSGRAEASVVHVSGATAVRS